MKNIIYNCDLCLEEIEDPEDLFTIRIPLHLTGVRTKEVHYALIPKEYEICSSCAYKIASAAKDCRVGAQNIPLYRIEL